MVDLSSLLSFFDGIQLADMDRVKLLNRVDTKFLVSPDVLFDCLAKHVDEFAVVDVNGQRQLKYETTYYDTDDLAMYHAHHNGKNNRYKVRYRYYKETNHQFLEIKHKEKYRTDKQRMAVNHRPSNLDVDCLDFVHANAPYYAEDLKPQLSTSFKRITLVNKSACERITIDLDVSFSNNTQCYELPNCAIVEIKRNKDANYSSFARTLKAKGFLPLSISKYCLGVVALNQDVKYNRFKPRLRQVDNLISIQSKHLCLVS